MHIHLYLVYQVLQYQVHVFARNYTYEYMPCCEGMYNIYVDLSVLPSCCLFIEPSQSFSRPDNGERSEWLDVEQDFRQGRAHFIYCSCSATASCCSKSKYFAAVRPMQSTQ